MKPATGVEWPPNLPPEMWLGLQEYVDLWDTLHERRKEYERIKRLETSKAA